MYTYEPYEWLAFFYIYCFFGWIFESLYVSLKSRRPVNRGFLRMPMLPLYGTGAVMMLWVSLPVKGNLFLVFLFGVVAATLLEYVTGYVMERLFKMKYWDYSGHKFQFKGYICLSSSIAWGFLTIFMTEVIHTPVEDLVLNLNPTVTGICLVPITYVFLRDLVKSTKTALDLGRMLETMDKLKREMEELQAQLGQLRAGTIQWAADLKDDTIQKAADFKTGTIQKAADFKTDTIQKAADFKTDTIQKAADFKTDTIQKAADFKEGTSQKAAGIKEETSRKAAEIKSRILELSEKRFRLTQHFTLYRGYIFRNNPSASSKTFSETFRELKEMLEQIRK